MNRFNHGRKVIYNIGYHIIWIPKYRRCILKGRFKEIILNALIEKSEQLGIKLEKYEIMPDHVHLFIKCRPKDKVCDIVRELKGYSSYILRKEYPKYKKYKGLWAPSYYCESIGHISESTVKKYIEDQWKNKEKKKQFIPSLK